jgi:hypothetical protein
MLVFGHNRRVTNRETSSMPVQQNATTHQNTTESEQQLGGLGNLNGMSLAVSGMFRHAAQTAMMLGITSGLFPGDPTAQAQGQEPVKPNPASAPKNPGEVLPAPAPAKALTYAEAVQSIKDTFDKQITGNGYTVSVSSKLFTDKELNALALPLINGAGAPAPISGMPKNFAENRLSKFREDKINTIPYVNHEGNIPRGYSVHPTFTPSKLIEPIKKMEGTTGLTVVGITPLDHKNALYAFAVEKADGTTSWGVAGIQTDKIPGLRKGDMPRNTDIQGAIPAMLRGLK